MKFIDYDNANDGYDLLSAGKKIRKCRWGTHSYIILDGTQLIRMSKIRDLWINMGVYSVSWEGMFVDEWEVYEENLSYKTPIWDVW